MWGKAEGEEKPTKTRLEEENEKKKDKSGSENGLLSFGQSPKHTQT